MGTTRLAADNPRTAELRAAPGDAPGDRALRPSAPRIAGVVFDVADVLYDATLWRRWLLRLVHQLGVAADYEAFYRSWDHDYLADVHRGRREYTEAFQSFLLARGLSWAQVDEVEAASRIQCANLDSHQRPWPGVVKTIEELKRRGLPLVAWSDSRYPAVDVARRLDQLGLAKSFRSVLSSFDHECAQPDEDCYRVALAALGLAVAETLYVGHDAEHLAAAGAMGLRTAAFNYERASRADVYLLRFEDLLATVTAGHGLPIRSPLAGQGPPESLRGEVPGACR